MPDIITISIDVTKLDKTKFKRITRKNGDPAVLVDIVLMPREDDYGNDYMVVQGLPKEERDQGIKGAILGNGKIMGQRKRTIQKPDPGAYQPPLEDSECPF